MAIGRAVVAGLIDAKPIRERKVGVALNASGGRIAGSASRQALLAPSTVGICKVSSGAGLDASAIERGGVGEEIIA